MREECIWLERGVESENGGGLRVFSLGLHLRWNGFLPNLESKVGEGENWWDIWIVLFQYDKDIKTYQNNTIHSNILIISKPHRSNIVTIYENHMISGGR